MIGKSSSMGLALEDRVMFVDIPIFLDIEPAITANIASISLFGVDIIAVCVLPIDLKKKKDKDKANESGGSEGGNPCDAGELGKLSALADKPLNAPSKLLAYYFTSMVKREGCKPRCTHSSLPLLCPQFMRL